MKRRNNYLNLDLRDKARLQEDRRVCLLKDFIDNLGPHNQISELNSTREDSDVQRLFVKAI